MPTLEDTIKKLDLEMDGTEEKVMNKIISILGDKLEEITSDLAEEKVSQMVNVLKGPEGKQGLEGIRGIGGEQGLQGERGDTGERGPRGFPGTDGKDGIDGLSMKGKDGKDGKSITKEEIKKMIQELLDKEPKQLGGFHRGGINMVFNEIPSGSINGSNTTFTLANTPKSGTEQLYLNGARLRSGAGNDYTISGGTITTLVTPLTGDNIICDYEKI